MRVLGPGLRAGVWVRGCSLGCPGCMSRELAERRPGAEVPVAVVAERLLAFAGRAAGLTVTGGEPFEQAAAVATLVARARESGLGDVLVYSGFTLGELRRRGKAAARLLELTDILIDGRFRRDQPTRKLWRGSANQRMHLLSNAARARYRHLVEAEYRGPRPVQADLDADGCLFVVGIPEHGDLRRLQESCRRRGIVLE